jgi:hypothetical protein
VTVNAGAACLDWHLRSGTHNGPEIVLVLTPQQTVLLMRKSFVITHQYGTEAPSTISVRVAQQFWITPQAELTNDQLPDFFRNVCTHLPDDPLSLTEEDEKIARHKLEKAPSQYRVQNGTIPEAGANMCAVSLAVDRAAALVVVDKTAYGFGSHSFCSMLRHENVHCIQYRESVTNGSFWHRVRDVQQVWDPDFDDWEWLMTPVCECEAWLWYLQDNDASYYFLLTYRVFTELENYILKARTLIRGLREKGSKQRPHLDAGFREQLAQECEAYLTRIIMRVRALFPELQELSDYPTFTG